MKTEIIEVHPQYPDLKAIARSAKIIRQGGLVVFPTETVYGIAADFDNPDAIKKLTKIKRRSANKPYSILISQRGLISNYTSMTDSRLYKLIDAYWPGPLTLVVPAKEEGQTVGVRMPDNIIALKLVAECQCSIAAPSANVEGAEPPSTCQEALKDLDGLVDLALDGGPAHFGRSSSIVDFTHGNPTVLREGAISQNQVDQVANKKTILFVCTGNSCRSVMAEFLLKDMLAGRDDVEILSAGTGVFINSTASAETISVLNDEGIDPRAHSSQPVSSVLLKKSDLIFVMTRNHRAQVLERVPSVEKHVYLLKEFTNIPADFHGDLDIPDPIGRNNQAYKECLSVIKEAICKIVELV